MSRIDACYAHLVFSSCAVGALLKQDSIGAAGIPWRLRHSCHPMQLARNRPAEDSTWLMTDDPAYTWIRDTWASQDVDPRLTMTPLN